MPGGNLPTLPVKRVVRPTPSIPDHEVVRQIGSGAYGEVWLARSLTGAWRAVKIVWREDFEEDATLLCTLDRIFDDATVFKLRGESFRGKKLETVSLQTGKVPAVETVVTKE